MPRTRRKKEPELEKRLRIFCEGEKTEPYYLKDYLRNFKDDRKASVEIMNCNKNTPVQLVEAAIKFKNSPRSIIGDVFWVVYDRESVAKYSREFHMQAWSTASQNNIEVALSNVCFEFWLLLHFVNSATPYSSCSDLLKNSALSDRVEQACGQKYDKTSAVLFEQIKDHISSARTRAEAINTQGLMAAGSQAMPFDINPYTDVHKLLDEIDGF
jgi:hypothetical protein